MTRTVIDVSGLRKEYRSTIGRQTITALDGITFTVGEGELFGLLGPNGAGKTTTIRILAGLSLPTSGIVRVAGHDVTTDAVAAKSVMGRTSAMALGWTMVTATDSVMASGPF